MIEKPIPQELKKGGPFDGIESPIRLTNAQVAQLWNLCTHPYVAIMARGETALHLSELADVLLDATESAIAAYVEGQS